MTSMGDIGQFDAVYCSHALEHLYPHEVRVALSEMHRVLKDGGNVVLLVPDLEGVPATDDVLPGSHLCGLQLIYGDYAAIPERPYMAHHCGFVASTLKAVLDEAGFKTTKTERLSFHNLMGIGFK